VDPILSERSRHRSSSRAVSPPAAGEPLPGRWLAVFIVAATFLTWLGFQTFQLARERFALWALRGAQENLLQHGQLVRAQLDSIERHTLELAAQGNQGAAAIIQQLERRGITITPSQPSSGSPASAPTGGSAPPAATPK